jgi:hypothetical protein
VSSRSLLCAVSIVARRQRRSSLHCSHVHVIILSVLRLLRRGPDSWLSSITRLINVTRRRDPYNSEQRVKQADRLFVTTCSPTASCAVSCRQARVLFCWTPHSDLQANHPVISYNHVRWSPDGRSQARLVVHATRRPLSFPVDKRTARREISLAEDLRGWSDRHPAWWVRPPCAASQAAGST